METIWKEVKDTSAINNIISTIQPDYASEPVLLNCNNTYEKNASFFFYVNKQYKVLYKVKEIIETDYYCKITCKMYSSLNKEQTMTKTVYLHYLGCNKTNLIYERNWSLGNFIQEEQEKIKEKENNEARVILNYIDRFINNNSHLKTQCEGKKLHINTIILIKTLFNFERKSFMTLFGFHSNKVPIREGAIISLRRKNKKDNPQRYFKLKFEIDHIHNNSRGLSAKVNVYELDDHFDSKANEEEKVSFPSRYIIHNIVMINHQETYYSMRHYFYHDVNKKTLDFVSQNKILFLEKLSRALESHSA